MKPTRKRRCGINNITLSTDTKAIRMNLAEVEYP